MWKGTLQASQPTTRRLKVRTPLSWCRTLAKWRPLPSLALAAFALLEAGNSSAQKETPQGKILEIENKAAAALTVHVDEVDLSFAVRDKHHRWINDLSQDEIRLRDNGQPPESIRMFQSEANLPLRIGLLVDTSDSISQQFDFEKRAAGLFISQIVDSSKDLAFVMGFNTEPYLIQDLTADTQALASGVKELDLGGGTAVYDAIDFAYHRLLQQGEKSSIRRVLILLTDGEDNSSHSQPEQIIKDALQYNIVVIVLDTQVDPDPETPQYKILQKLAKETGGQLLPAGKKKDLERTFKELSTQLRSYYRLAYRPAQFIRDGTFRKIQLKTTRRGAHIICRRGYYATAGADER